MQPTDNTPQPGVTDPDEYQRQLAAVMIMQAANKPKAEAKPAAPAPAPPVDEFERIEKIREAQRAEGHEPHQRPHKQPGPGLLLRLAHWLNLK